MPDTSFLARFCSSSRYSCRRVEVADHEPERLRCPLRAAAGRLVEGDQGLLVAPLEERVEDRPGLLTSDLLAFLSRRGLDGALDAEEALDQREGVLGELGFRAQRLEKIPPGMRPACHFDHVAVLVQVVVDGGGVGDEVALVAGEQDVDRGAVVRVRVAVEDVALGRDQDPEVGPPALLLRLDEDAGGICAQIGCREGVLEHRLDERLPEVLAPVRIRRIAPVFSAGA